ncbi:cytochrome P450 family protein [Streptomyces sp. 8L]|uniref:cytochrome P450 family protein n=1 Tax=Streptomyces sp. 8L TaxID=2877242 RepID=UPI001CD4FA14|nr:cytochrome P450 [Streptomyces sp. 8L]MCA1222672.1 cytochrome P450 [Streptomyces sp. 8L]
MPGQNQPRTEDPTELVDMIEDPAGFVADPHARYALLRAGGAVRHVRLPDGATAWLVLGHDLVRAALTDPGLCNDIRHSATRLHDGGFAVGRNMLQADPPDHTRLRRLVAREFTGRRVEALRPRVERITDELLDAMLPAGHADLVDALAFPLPVTVICELLGVPRADRDDFRRWSAEVVAATDPVAAATAQRDMAAYLTELIAAKRAAGRAGGSAHGSADDLLTALARTPADGEEGLSAEELLGMAFLLLVAGHETTANLISSAVHLLLRHPDQLAALRADASLLEAAVEESLRYEPATLATNFRYAARDVELGGVTVPAGDTVIVSLASANRDPLAFRAPDRFDIRRDPAELRRHVTFGHGIHHCLGAPLARLEAPVALRALLTRCPELALDPERGSATWRPSLLHGLATLPVRWPTPVR